MSGIMLLIIGGWSVYFYTDPNQSYSTWQMPFWPHWTIGGVLSNGRPMSTSSVAGARDAR